MDALSSATVQLPKRLFGVKELEWASIKSSLAVALIRGISQSQLQHWKERLGVGKDYDPLWAYRTNFRPELPA